MDLWFTEHHSKGVSFSIKVEKQLVSCKSEFQQIDIFETPEFGKILVLDGLLMLTEKDEFIYHEMITHVAMATNPNIRKVLIIGGGDGGAIRELVKYDSIEKIDIVEIDKMVIDVCKEFIPQTASGFSDKRVEAFYQDGLKYIRTVKNEYDLIIVDSTDPFGVAEGLFTKQFYGNCYCALKEDGILVNQLESVFYEEYAMSMNKAKTRLNNLFEVSKVFQAHIPTYPSGHWLFGFSSKKFDPIKDFNKDLWLKKGIETKYYNTDLHVGTFAIPTYVREVLGLDET